MRALGYALSHQVIDAADLGVPQHRRRLFIVGTRSTAPLTVDLPRLPHVPAASFLAGDPEQGRWSLVAAKCPRTRERVAVGRRQYGDRFLIAYYGTARGGRSLARPIGTVTTLDRYALVDGDRLRMLTPEEYRAAMGFPAGYQLPSNRRLAIHLLGNAVCPPVAAAVIGALN
jgi:DNA (cytosine-5)-methyltransferase 1